MSDVLDFSTDNWSFLTAHYADQQRLFPSEPAAPAASSDPLSILIDLETANEEFTYE